MKIANAQIESYIKNIANQKIAACVVFGPEASLVNYRFNLIAKAIVPDLSDPFLVANISKERLTENKGILADEFLSVTMMGGRKLIMIKDCDSEAAAALNILCQDDDLLNKGENFILIQAKDLSKSAPLRKLSESNDAIASIACYADNENVIRKFIIAQLQERNIVANKEVVAFLLEKFGTNRQIILSELAKIDLFFDETSTESKVLTLDLATKLVASESEISTNEFVMNFAAKKFDTAFIQLEKLFKNGVEPITVIRFLTNYLQKLYHSKLEIESGRMSFDEAVKAQYLFFKTEIEFKKHLQLLSGRFLARALQKLPDLEIKIKSGVMPPKLLFAAFVQGCIK